MSYVSCVSYVYAFSGDLATALEQQIDTKKIVVLIAYRMAWYDVVEKTPYDDNI
jgi:hypothetical protein